MISVIVAAKLTGYTLLAVFAFVSLRYIGRQDAGAPGSKTGAAAPGGLPSKSKPKKKKKKEKESKTKAEKSGSLISDPAPAPVSTNNAEKLTSPVEDATVEQAVVAKSKKSKTTNETERVESGQKPEPAPVEPPPGPESTSAVATADMTPPSPPATLKILKLVGSIPTKQTAQKKSQPAAEAPTKKQRQNKKKAEMAKEAKAMQAKVQEERLQEYKRQRARELVAEQQTSIPRQISRSYASTSSPAKQRTEPSNGYHGQQVVAVDENWEPVPRRKTVKDRRKSTPALEPEIPDSRYSALVGND